MPQMMYVAPRQILLHVERGTPSLPDGIDAELDSPDAVIALSFPGLIATGHTCVPREQPLDHSRLRQAGEGGVTDKSRQTLREMISRTARSTDHSAFLCSHACLLFKLSGSHMKGHSTLSGWLRFEQKRSKESKKNEGGWGQMLWPLTRQLKNVRCQASDGLGPFSLFVTRAKES